MLHSDLHHRTLGTCLNLEMHGYAPHWLRSHVHCQAAPLSSEHTWQRFEDDCIVMLLCCVEEAHAGFLLLSFLSSLCFLCSGCVLWHVSLGGRCVHSQRHCSVCPVKHAHVSVTPSQWMPLAFVVPSCWQGQSSGEELLDMIHKAANNRH